MAKKIKKVEEGKQLPIIPIKWNVPDTIISRFASNMVVQTIEGSYFKLTFFELKPEIHLVPPHTPQKEMIADCVASIIIPPEKIPAIIKVLQTQFKQYKDQLSKLFASNVPEQPS